MPARRFVSAVIWLSVFAGGGFTGRSVYGAPRTVPPLEEVVVRLAPGASPADLARIAKGQGWRLSRSCRPVDPGISRDLWRARQKSASSTSSAVFAKALGALPSVRSTLRNPVFRVKPHGTPRNGPDGGGGFGGDQSEMPAFDDEITLATVVAQPALEAVGAPEAHLRVQGRGVVIAVLDGGFDLSHQVFAGRLAPDLYDAISGDPDPQDLGNGFDDDGDCLFDGGVGHGTAVAGLAALSAPGAWILPVRVLDDEGNGDALSLAFGIHAALERGARVICLAASGNEFSPLIEEAMERAWRQGVLVVCSPGNEGLPSVNYPGSSPFALCPIGTTTTGAPDPVSNYGLAVDIGAPSTDVLAPSREGPMSYAHWNGTSFSTSICAGCAALVLESSPWMNGELAAWWLEVQADPYTAFEAGMVRKVGTGLLDADGATLAP